MSDNSGFDFSSDSSSNDDEFGLGVIVSPGTAIVLLAVGLVVWGAYRTVKAESHNNIVAANTAVCLAGDDPANRPPSFGTLWSFPNAEIPSSPRTISFSNDTVIVTEGQGTKTFLGPDNSVGTRYFTTTYSVSLNGQQPNAIGHGHIDVHGDTRRMAADSQDDDTKFSPDEASRVEIIKRCVSEAIQLVL